MILDSVGHVLPGCLPASFRGVSFFVPDASTEAGRRVAEALFPGVDRAAYDDLGLAPAVINIEGMMVGDDYVIQARALQVAFERPGPGTLIHPWLGAMSVILEEPGEISFSSTELRVARFSATFKRAPSGLLSFGGTAAVLLTAVTVFLAAVRSLGASPATTTLSRVSTLAAGRTGRLVSGIWSDVATGLAGPAIRTVLPGAGASDAQALSTAIATISDTVVSLVPAVAGEAAVAPAAGAAEAAGLSPADAIALLLDAGSRIVALQDDAPATADRVMLISAGADAIGTAVSLSVYVDHASRQDALAMRGDLTAAIDTVRSAAGAIDAAEYAGAAAVGGRAALDLRAALAADINETIGRLPSVVVVTTTGPTDAFVLANDLYGDRVEAIEAGYRSIVERNRPRHPATLPAGRIEALK